LRPAGLAVKCRAPAQIRAGASLAIGRKNTRKVWSKGIHFKRWGTAISDDAIHVIVARVAARNKGTPLPMPTPPKIHEQLFSLVIMIDG